MRFVIVVAEIIGNASTPVQYLDPDLIGPGGPIHMACAEIMMAFMRTLPCCNRASHNLLAFAAKAMTRATGGRFAFAA